MLTSLRKKHYVYNDRVNNYSELQYKFFFNLTFVILRTWPYLLPPNPFEQFVIHLERSQYLQNVNNCYELVNPYRRMIEKSTFTYIFLRKIIIRNLRCAYLKKPTYMTILSYRVKEIKGGDELSILKNMTVSYHTQERELNLIFKRNFARPSGKVT